MRDSAQVVVIGGGVVGASVLYHLTRAGVRDAVLLERSELTSGSTWHAAGGMHTLNGDPDVAALQKYTVELYREIEQVSGIDCGIHLTGGLLLADTEERMDWLRLAHARNRYLGLETELIGVQEAQEFLPIMDGTHFVGAMYDPVEGDVDPSGVTRAFARAARLGGAEVVLHTRVQAVSRLPDGRWRLDCGDQGAITCEHVVNAGGLWAREVGRMFGVELPVQAMEHMYLVTEDVPALDGSPLFHAMDFAGEVYLRKEGRGLLLGTYEPNGVPWSPHTTPWDFGHQLLAPDLERIADNLAVAFDHFPIFHEVGIRTVVNGPFTFTPDGNPLVGPVRGQPGHWLACGVMAGLSQGGGVGLALSRWITEGDPGLDVWGMDPARFGDWTTPSYTRAKVVENYGRRFRIPYPNEQLPAARPLQTSPIHARLDAEGAVWGAAYGLEQALWFQRGSQQPASERLETPTLRRSNAWSAVAEESRAVRDGVGMIETTGFAKHEFTGPGARTFLDRMLCNRLPATGRITLSPMLDDRGHLIGDFTVAALPPARVSDGPERLLVFGSGVATAYHGRWFEAHVPTDGSVSYRSLGPSLTGLSIAGPASREVLAAVCDADVSAEAFGFLDVRSLDVGMVPALVGRISFTGDLGYELWVGSEYLPRLYDVLTEAGRPHGLRLFGAHALNSLRLEKSYGAWATEYRPTHTADEAGLGRFVRPEKGDFIGREAVLSTRDRAPSVRLVSFVVDTDPGPDGADVIGDEPVWYGDEVVGRVTSGGFAHASECSVALGYIPEALAAELAAADTPGDGVAIEVLGVRREATPLARCLFDPDGVRMRG